LASLVVAIVYFTVYDVASLGAFFATLLGVAGSRKRVCVCPFTFGKDFQLKSPLGEIT